MLTVSQSEVIRFLHEKNYDAEPSADDKVQVLYTWLDKRGFVRQRRHVICASLGDAQAWIRGC